MMDAFAKYSVLDWVIMLQVVLIWLYISFNAGGWIFGLMARIGWRWWNRKDKKLWQWIRSTRRLISKPFSQVNRWSSKQKAA